MAITVLTHSQRKDKPLMLALRHYFDELILIHKDENGYTYFVYKEGLPYDGTGIRIIFKRNDDKSITIQSLQSC